MTNEEIIKTELGAKQKILNKEPKEKKNIRMMCYYFLGQIGIFLISIVWSNRLGEAKRYDAYPFMTDFFLGIPGVAFISSFHLLNVYTVIKKENWLGLSRRARFNVTFLNILMSVFVFLQLYLLVQRPESMTGVMYNVIDTS